MTTTALTRTSRIDEDDQQTYVGIYLLKKLDLKPEDGGIRFPVVLPSEYAPLDDYLQELAVQDLLEIDAKAGVWKLTKAGIAHIGSIIDEAEALIEEFDELEEDEVPDALRAAGLDPLRARFLWGWYDGEFDDLVAFQRQRGLKPVETLWAFYLTDRKFLELLAEEVDVPTHDA